MAEEAGERGETCFLVTGRCHSVPGTSLVSALRHYEGRVRSLGKRHHRQHHREVMKPPSLVLDNITALQPPSLRREIPAAWADANGHMNMRWFVALFDDAGDELHERAGLT